MRIAVTQNKHRASHLADVEVHADVKRFADLDGFGRAVQRAVKLGVDRAAGEVDELAVEIGGEEVGGVGIAQAVDVAIGEVVRVRHGGRADQAITVSRVLGPALIDKPKAFRGSGNTDRIGRAVRFFLTVACNDLVPDLAGLVDWQCIEFVANAVSDLIGDDPRRVLHRAQDDRAAIPDLNEAVVLVDLEACPHAFKFFLKARKGHARNEVIGRQVVGDILPRIAPLEPESAPHRRL